MQRTKHTGIIAQHLLFLTLSFFQVLKINLIGHRKRILASLGDRLHEDPPQKPPRAISLRVNTNPPLPQQKLPSHYVCYVFTHLATINVMFIPNITHNIYCACMCSDREMLLKENVTFCAIRSDPMAVLCRSRDLTWSSRLDQTAALKRQGLLSLFSRSPIETKASPEHQKSVAMSHSLYSFFYQRTRTVWCRNSGPYD